MEQYFTIVPVCILSLISNLSIVYRISTNPEMRAIYEYRFILLFSAIDATLDISTALPSVLFPSNNTLCTVQGMLIQTSSLSGILWILFITIAMVREIVLVKRRFSKGLIIPMLLILAFSLTTAIIPMIFNAYRLSGGWCWFETPKPEYKIRDYLFRYAMFYGITWIVIIFNIIVNLLIKHKANNEQVYDLVGMRLARRLKWYPWILCVCYTPLTLCRIIEGLGNLPAWILILSSAIVRLIGLCNCIAFFHGEKLEKKQKHPALIP